MHQQWVENQSTAEAPAAKPGGEAASFLRRGTTLCQEQWVFYRSEGQPPEG